MIFSLLYIVLAALGLGFLIFIHELGHYWVARRQGMTVEIFSIGFGKPFRTWEYQGVKWQLCVLPFGGYVRIAGMEKKGALEPHQIPDGFYGKGPLARIKVALAGPVVNIAFAFLAFLLLFFTGGRLKPFSEYTKIIGWVDPSSALYHAEVRAGDQIEQLNNRPFKQFQDLLYAAVLEEKAPEIKGEREDYFTAEKTPFTFSFPLDSRSTTGERISTIFSALGPASYLIYRDYPSHTGVQGTPMQDSGIAPRDRIVWVDGDVVFSKEQLISLVNQPKALLTIQRGEDAFLVRVPRLKASDLRISSVQKAELQDWQHASQMKVKSPDFFFIPYTLTPNAVVESTVTYLNEETLEQEPLQAARSPLEAPLQPGDQILAVDGMPIVDSISFLEALQTRRIQIIVNKEKDFKPPLWKDADTAFINDIDWKGLNQMIHSIGTANPLQELGTLKRLNPVIPLQRSEYPYSDAVKERIAKDYEQQRKAAEKIEDKDQREEVLRQIEGINHQWMLGIAPIDRQVIYNPSPFALFGNVFKETWRTLVALFSGNVSPKYMQGPVGIVQVMQHSWGVGIKEALFWLGMISLNLGVLNLLPIPVLDGGHICFSLWEGITKKPIPAKTMERLIIPFIVLLVALFIYLTYHDVMRLFSRFF